jgi:uncharacterized protein YbjT (DUF2867 family)
MHSGKVILITGGTGQVGTAAAAALLRRGCKVRVITRDYSSAKADAARTMGADVGSGDLDDRESLHRAMTGVHGVFCVPPLVTSFMPAGSFERQLAGSKNVIDAAADANVAHCVLLSANSAEKGVNSNLQNKFLMEQYLRAKRLSATFLRPVVFMDNFVLPQWGLHQGVFTTALLPSTKQQLIAVADIGALAALMFEQGTERGISSIWFIRRRGGMTTPCSRSTLLHQRGSALADFLKCRFEATKLLRAQFREHSLHLPGMLSKG